MPGSPQGEAPWYAGAIYDYQLVSGTWTKQGEIPDPSPSIGGYWPSNMDFDGSRLIATRWNEGVCVFDAPGTWNDTHIDTWIVTVNDVGIGGDYAIWSSDNGTTWNRWYVSRCVGGSWTARETLYETSQRSANPSCAANALGFVVCGDCGYWETNHSGMVRVYAFVDGAWQSVANKKHNTGGYNVGVGASVDTDGEYIAQGEGLTSYATIDMAIYHGVLSAPSAPSDAAVSVRLPPSPAQHIGGKVSVKNYSSSTKPLCLLPIPPATIDGQAQKFMTSAWQFTAVELVAPEKWAVVYGT